MSLSEQLAANVLMSNNRQKILKINCHSKLCFYLYNITKQNKTQYV